eukprot:scaffold3605_cov430-Prasinococcus_capsulatus_cf.AAC.2
MHSARRTVALVSERRQLACSTFPCPETHRCSMPAAKLPERKLRLIYHWGHYAAVYFSGTLPCTASVSTLSCFAAGLLAPFEVAATTAAEVDGSAARAYTVRSMILHRRSCRSADATTPRVTGLAAATVGPDRLIGLRRRPPLSRRRSALAPPRGGNKPPKGCPMGRSLQSGAARDGCRTLRTPRGCRRRSLPRCRLPRRAAMLPAAPATRLCPDPTTAETSARD